MEKGYIKTGFICSAIIYAILGSFYNLTSPIDLTGHHSADIYWKEFNQPS